MNETIRITVVGLLPESMNDKSIAGFLDQTVADEAPSAIRTIYKAAELDTQRQRTYVKISRLINVDELKDGWHLTVTERLRDVGCAEVAWRVTKIEPGTTDPENTTASFPIELFQSGLENDAEEIFLSEAPTEPFGSDPFWKRFDDDAD